MMSVVLAIVAAFFLFFTGIADLTVSQDIDSRLARYDYDFPFVQSAALQSVLKDGTAAAFYGGGLHWIMAAVMFLFSCIVGPGLSIFVALADLIVSAVVCYECWIEGEKDYAKAELFCSLISAVAAIAHSVLTAEEIRKQKAEGIGKKRQKEDSCDQCCGV